MKYVRLVAAFLVFLVGVNAHAQYKDTATWPLCIPGGAPVAKGPLPPGAQVFKTTKEGPVVMTEAGKDGKVPSVRCRLPVGTELYRGADGDLRDVASNQVLWTVGSFEITDNLPTGKSGTSCSVIPTSDGAVISCTDGTMAHIMNGKPGKNGEIIVPKDSGLCGSSWRSPRRIGCAVVAAVVVGVAVGSGGGGGKSGEETVISVGANPHP